MNFKKLTNTYNQLKKPCIFKIANIINWKDYINKDKTQTSQLNDFMKMFINQNKNEKIPIVYKLVNLFNGLIYIGKTINLKHRMSQHLKETKSNTRLHNAMRTNEFTCEIIYICKNEKEAYKKETEYIESFNSAQKNIGYNLVGGQRESTYVSYVPANNSFFWGVAIIDNQKRIIFGQKQINDKESKVCLLCDASQYKDGYNLTHTITIHNKQIKKHSLSGLLDTDNPSIKTINDLPLKERQQMRKDGIKNSDQEIVQMYNAGQITKLCIDLYFKDLLLF